MLIRFATSVCEDGTFITKVFVRLVDGNYVYKSYKHTTMHSNNNHRTVAIACVMKAVKRNKVPVNEKDTSIPESMQNAKMHSENITDTRYD